MRIQICLRMFSTFGNSNEEEKMKNFYLCNAQINKRHYYLYTRWRKMCHCLYRERKHFNNTKPYRMSGRITTFSSFVSCGSDKKNTKLLLLRFSCEEIQRFCFVIMFFFGPNWFTHPYPRNLCGVLKLSSDDCICFI